MLRDLNPFHVSCINSPLSTKYAATVNNISVKHKYTIVINYNIQH